MDTRYTNIHRNVPSWNGRISSGGVEIRRDGRRRARLAMKRKEEGKAAVVRWIFLKRGWSRMVYHGRALGNRALVKDWSRSSISFSNAPPEEVLHHRQGLVGCPFAKKSMSIFRKFMSRLNRDRVTPCHWSRRASAASNYSFLTTALSQFLLSRFETGGN